MKTSFEFPEPDNSRQDIKNFAKNLREEITRTFYPSDKVALHSVVNFVEGKVRETMIREKWEKHQDIY